MSEHTHSSFVDGCYRCELHQDEIIRGLAEERESELTPLAWLPMDYRFGFEDGARAALGFPKRYYDASKTGE